MRTYATFFMLGTAFILSTTTRAEERTWSDASGKYKIQAEYIGIDGDKVSLKNQAGKVITLPLGKLSKEDQAIALELAGKKSLAQVVVAPNPPKAGDVTITAKARTKHGVSMVNRVRKEFRNLIIEVTMKGGAAADAFSLGPVAGAEVLFDGKPLEIEESFGSGHFELIDRVNGGILTSHPKDGIRFEIHCGQIPEGATVFGPVKGSIQFDTGGTAKTVTIADVLTRSTGLVNDPQLAAVAMTAKFTRVDSGDEVELGIQPRGKGAAMLAGLELIGPDGATIDGNRGTMEDNSGMHYTLAAPKDALQGASLKLLIREGAKRVDLPFQLAEVTLGGRPGVP